MVSRQNLSGLIGRMPINDVTHTLHYLLKILENMKRLDVEWHSEGEDVDDAEVSAAS